MTNKTKKNKRRILLLASALGGAVLVGTAASLVSSCGEAAKPEGSTSGSTASSGNAGTGGTGGTSGSGSQTTTPGSGDTSGTTTPSTDADPNIPADVQAMFGTAVRLNPVDSSILAENPARSTADVTTDANGNATYANNTTNADDISQQNSDFVNYNGSAPDYNSNGFTLSQDYYKKLQDALSQTFVFTGGRETAPSWNDSGDTKNFVNLFEDNLRDLNADFSSKTGVLQTVSRFVVNTARQDLTLHSLVQDQEVPPTYGGETAFQQKVADLDPKYVVYQLTDNDLQWNSDHTMLNQWDDVSFYKTHASAFIDDVLALRDNTAQLIVVTPYSTTEDYTLLRNQFMEAAYEKYHWAEQSVAGSGAALLSRIKFVNLGADTVAGGDVSAFQAENNKARDIFNSLTQDASGNPLWSGAPSYTDVALDENVGQLDGTRSTASNGLNVEKLWVRESRTDANAANGTPINGSSHLTSLYLALDDNATDQSWDGKPVSWKVSYPDLGLTISDDSVLHKSPTVADSVSITSEETDTAAQTADFADVATYFGTAANQNQLGLEIPFINSDKTGAQGTTESGEATNAAAGQKVQITVTDPNGNDYNVWSGVLADTESKVYTDNATAAAGNGTENLADQQKWGEIGTAQAAWNEDDPNTTSGSLADVAATPNELNTLDGVQLDTQKAFLAKFNATDKPLKWLFLGSTADQRSGTNADGTLGFNNYAQAIEKSVKGEWGRADDIFINATMIGDFTNRAVDANLIQARIAKYKADVVVLSYGLTEAMNNGGYDKDGNPVRPFTDESIPFGDTNPANGDANNSLKSNLTTLVNAIKSANNNAIVVVNPVNPTADATDAIYGYTNAGNTTSYTPEGTAGTLGESGADATANGAAGVENNALDTLLGADGSTTSGLGTNVLYNYGQFDLIKGIYDKYKDWIGKDGLFMSKDLLAGPNVHLLEARSILSTLGVNVTNSYLDSYLLSAKNVTAEAPATLAGTASGEEGTATPNAFSFNANWTDAAASQVKVTGSGSSEPAGKWGPGGVYYGAGYGYASIGRGLGLDDSAADGNAAQQDKANNIFLNDSVGVFTDRISYATAQYVNGATDLTSLGQVQGIGQEAIRFTVPSGDYEVGTAADAAITSAPRVYDLVWTPNGTYTADQATSTADAVVFNAPISWWFRGMDANTAYNFLPPGTTVQGWAISSERATAEDGTPGGYVYALPETPTYYFDAAA